MRSRLAVLLSVDHQCASLPIVVLRMAQCIRSSSVGEVDFMLDEKSVAKAAHAVMLALYYTCDTLGMDCTTVRTGCPWHVP